MNEKKKKQTYLQLIDNFFPIFAIAYLEKYF